MHTIDNKSLLKALRVLDGADADAPQRNRRNFRRFPARATATLSIDPLRTGSAEATAYAVELRDVGRGGVGLLCPRGVELNRVYRLVCLQDGVELFSMPVVPRHAKHVDGGVWLIGAVAVAEAATMVSLGIGPHDVRVSEAGPDIGPGEFAPVAAA